MLFNHFQIRGHFLQNKTPVFQFLVLLNKVLLKISSISTSFSSFIFPSCDIDWTFVFVKNFVCVVEIVEGFVIDIHVGALIQA